MSVLDDINRSTSTTIRVDVPMSMHPDYALPFATPLGVEGTVGPHVYRATRTALKSFYEGLGAMLTADRAMRVPVASARREIDGATIRTAVPPERRREFTAALDAAFHRAARAGDAQLANIKEHREAIAAKVAAAVVDPVRERASAVSVAEMVLAHAKSLGKTERMTFLSDAVDAADLTTVSAVLHAPAYLSGLTPAERATFRDRAERKFAPVEAAQRDAADRAIQTVMEAGAQFVAQFGKLRPREQAHRTAQDAALERLRKGEAVDA